MRSYPIDSPEAAARILAMTLVADSGPGNAEFHVLKSHDAAGQLGLTSHRLHTALREFCEDLLTGSEHSWSHACRLDESSMAAIMNEVQDDHLRERLMRLCVAVVEADGRIEEGESSILSTAMEQWGLSASRLLEPRAEKPRSEAFN